MLHCSCMLTSVAVQASCVAGRASWPVKFDMKVHKSWESLPDLMGSDAAIRWVQASASAITLQHGKDSVSQKQRLLSADSVLLIVVHQAATRSSSRVHWICTAIGLQQY